MSILNPLQFVPGQRWISNTESELGLGIVSSTDHRHVTVSFPAAGEQRVYAMNNAPLSRVLYRVDDIVANNDGLQMQIRQINDSDGYVTYTGQLTSAGTICDWGEMELDCFVQFSKPQDRLFAGQVDNLREFNLRYQALMHQQQLSGLDTTGLLGPRVQLLPHQFYIANEVGRRFAPRVLLADEVGLGKTIEAGLIMHQQLLLGYSQRVLIVVPETLVHQWLVEMLRRFNLHFSLLDAERIEDAPDSGKSNPFEETQLVITSLRCLADNEERLQKALDCQWDLLVVDEAHHLEWHPESASAEYSAVEKLAQRTSGLLLLTATPEQLGIESHFARLRLLDPDRYFSLPVFVEEQAQFRAVNQLAQALDGEESLDHYLHDDRWLQELEQRLGADAAVQLRRNPQLREVLLQQLLDRHGTGRVLFRNTRAAIQGFPGRRLQQWPLPDSTIQEDLAQQPKVVWLQHWLKQHRHEKILLICSSADLALDLETHLKLRSGVRSAVFYEGLSLIERDRAAAYFADLEDGAQILVCSEIGSEGRNFQFAHHLVMFDLPLNPDLIEQRIGRLDRIGQSCEVQIHVPFIENSSENSREEKLLQWYQRGLNCIEQVCPAAQSIFLQMRPRLLQCLDGDGDLDSLITETRLQTERMLEQMREGRDRLLELNSCRPALAEQLIGQLRTREEDSQLEPFMQDVFEVFGIDHERHSDKAFVARPSDHMQCDHFPGLSEDGVTATYCRLQALSRDDMQFLTWEHPMVTGVMDMIINRETGNTAVCSMRLPPLQAGSFLVEAVFQFACPAPKALQLQRFLHNSCIRLLSDNELRALEKIVSAEHIQRLGQTVRKANAKQALQHARQPLEAIISHLQQRSSALLPDLIRTATAEMTQYYQQELQRLTALAQVNPNIRAEELQFLKSAMRDSEVHLNGAQLRMDAIRVIFII